MDSQVYEPSIQEQARAEIERGEELDAIRAAVATLRARAAECRQDELPASAAAYDRTADQLERLAQRLEAGHGG